MAWNPSKEVAVARDAAKALGADRAVIVYTLPSGMFGYASYGETKALCAEARALGDKLFDATQDHFGYFKR